MEVTVPFHIEYDTPNAVPISEVIDALVSAKAVLEEGGYALGDIVPGLTVQNVQVSIRSISQESPLRELLFVSLFLAFQKDLEEEVPPIIEKLTGLDVPESAETIISLAAFIVIFYGAAYAKDILSKMAENTDLKNRVDALILELSKETMMDPDHIRAKLDSRYKKQSRLDFIASTAVKFFRPSKSQGNATVTVNRRRIEPRLIDSVPNEYAFEEAAKQEYERNYEQVSLDVHAQGPHTAFRHPYRGRRRCIGNREY